MRGAALAALAALAVAGCGGTDLSNTQLRNQAGRICAAADTKTDAIPAPGLSGSAAFLRQGLAVLTPELAQLERLHPPAAAKAVYASALAHLHEELADLTAAKRALAHGGDPTIVFPALQKQLTPLEAVENREWHALAVPGCVGG